MDLEKQLDIAYGNNERLIETITELQKEIAQLKENAVHAPRAAAQMADDLQYITELETQLATWTEARQKSDDALIAAKDRIIELEAKIKNLEESVQRWRNNYYAAVNKQEPAAEELNY